MAYALYVNHPETFVRQGADFATWRLWAKTNAPWTGVGIDSMAEILTAVCASRQLPEICTILDQGGDLPADAARTVLERAEAVLEPETRAVLHAGVESGYGVRVIFSASLGQAISASAYAEKFGSASAH